MAVKTANNYGLIMISNNAIANLAGYYALDCYGVVDLVPGNFGQNLLKLLKKRNYGTGVKVVAKQNRISLTLNVIIKYGVSVNAVADSLKKSVKYSVEEFTGMLVENINVKVIGVSI